MHAVVVRVTINDVEAAEKALREQTVPRVSQAPGFVTGHWTRKGNTGVSMVIFESEEAAQGASERIRANPPDGVTVDDVEVREVVANA
jgi:hypothetical protein